MNSEKSVLKIEPGNYRKKVRMPFSKSYANRALAIAALVPGEFKVQNIASSSDVKKMVELLKKIGLNLVEDIDSITIKNSFPECEVKSDEVIKLETGDGGTTNRILLGILSRGENTYELISTEKFKDRPNQEGFNILEKLGVKTQLPRSSDAFWIKLQGPANSLTELEVNCEETTQFYTAFKVFELLDDINVSTINLKTSKKYVAITDKLVHHAKENNEIKIPIDFSSASYPIVFGSVRNEIIIENCDQIDPLQADSAVIEIVNHAGGNVHLKKDVGLVIKPSKLVGFEVDCSDFPDLVPSLVFLALNSSGESILKNVSVLRHKESDRLEEILKITELIGSQVLFNDEKDELIITGDFSLKMETKFKLPSDHRMIMLASMLIRGGNNSGTVDNILHVNKSYPAFFEDLLDI